jgi:RsiW-degrading membrane proteinase PrsW (M82 family)
MREWLAGSSRVYASVSTMMPEQSPGDVPLVRRQPRSRRARTGEAARKKERGGDSKPRVLCSPDSILPPSRTGPLLVAGAVNMHQDTAMEIILLALLAVIPSLLLMWFFHARDRFPEPPGVLWRTFLLGVLTIPAAVGIELALSGISSRIRPLELSSLFDAFVVAALVEETLKLVVIRFYSLRRKAFDEVMDGLVYGAASGLGFATLENVMYVFTQENGLAVGIMRAIMSVPGHACWGAVLGFYAARGLLSGRPFRGMMTGLAMAVLLHGLYDYPVMLFSSGSGLAGGVAILLFLATLGVCIGGWVLVIRLSRGARREQAGLAPGDRAGDRGGTGPRSVGRARGILMLVPGALLSTAGAVMILAVAAACAMGQVERGREAETLLGTLIVGALPLAAGLPLFVKGIRRLNRHGPRPTARPEEACRV